MSEIQPPEEFQRIGFSGQFNLEVDLTPDSNFNEWALKAPCLLPGDKWLLMSVDQFAGTAVVVRRDDCALADLVFSPFPRIREGKS